MISDISNFSFNVALISDDYFESFLPAPSDVTGVVKTTRSNRLKLRLYLMVMQSYSLDQKKITKPLFCKWISALKGQLF